MLSCPLHASPEGGPVMDDAPELTIEYCQM